MLLAEEAAASTSAFQYFDLFMIVITLIFAWAVVRQAKQRPRNLFALGFAVVGLLGFLFADVIMILGW